MRYLVIETASTACSVALFEKSLLLADFHENVGRGHAERLIPMIGELPDKGRADAILVDCGPGSFTGVRVGLAAARGLGLGWNVPVYGFSGMALIAASASIDMQNSRTLAVAINGGHGQFFVQSFATGPVHPMTELASLLPDHAAVHVMDTYVAGNAAQQLVDIRESGTALAVNIMARNAIYLPEAMRSLPPLPIYGRAPDAKPMA